MLNPTECGRCLRVLADIYLAFLMSTSVAPVSGRNKKMLKMIRDAIFIVIAVLLGFRPFGTGVRRA